MWVDYLEIAGALIGLIYLYLEYRASVWLWLAGIIMPAVYIYVYYEAGFYADMGINVYYLAAGLYGWAAWLGKTGRRHTRRKKTVPAAGAPGSSSAIATPSTPVSTPASITSASAGVSSEAPPSRDEKEMPVTLTPGRAWLPMALVAAAFFAAISYILTNFTDSTVPYGDSLTTALSVVAMWMLSRKYAEQWLVWLVVDVISCGLYLYKGLYPTAALYGLYSVIAVFGYLKWLKMARTAAENEK